MFLDRFGTGVDVALVLPSHAGLSLVTVTFTEWLSSDAVGFREVGVAWFRRLAGRLFAGESAPIIRVPNLAFAEDSRPYAVV